MTYTEFLNSLSGVISLFVDGLISIANNLIHNYFFVSILGIVMFCSIFWVVFHIIEDFIFSKIDRYEEYNDLYENYVLKKEVQSDYLDNHYNDEFDYVYRKKLLGLQVMNGLYQNNKDLIIDNKVNNLDCNVSALKELKKLKLLDNDKTNDNDVDMLIPNPPIQMASVSELKNKPMSYEELHSLHEELEQENNAKLDSLENELSK